MSKKKNFDAGKTTKTGELIPSMFNWIDPDKQAAKSQELAKNTEKSIKPN